MILAHGNNDFYPASYKIAVLIHTTRVGIPGNRMMIWYRDVGTKTDFTIVTYDRSETITVPTNASAVFILHIAMLDAHGINEM